MMAKNNLWPWPMTIADGEFPRDGWCEGFRSEPPTALGWWFKPWTITGWTQRIPAKRDAFIGFLYLAVKIRKMAVLNKHKTTGIVDLASYSLSTSIDYCIYTDKNQPATVDSRMISHALREVSSEPVPGHAFLMSSCGATAQFAKHKPQGLITSADHKSWVWPQQIIGFPQIEHDHFGLGMTSRIVSLVISYTPGCFKKSGTSGTPSLPLPRFVPIFRAFKLKVAMSRLSQWWFQRR